MVLSSVQQRALALLREGVSTGEVAEQLGLPRTTVWRWQNELVEFADTRDAPTPEPSGWIEGPLTRQDLLRIGAPIMLLALTALFFYLGYC